MKKVLICCAVTTLIACSRIADSERIQQCTTFLKLALNEQKTIDSQAISVQPGDISEKKLLVSRYLESAKAIIYQLTDSAEKHALLAQYQSLYQHQMDNPGPATTRMQGAK